MGYTLIFPVRNLLGRSGPKRYHSEGTKRSLPFITGNLRFFPGLYFGGLNLSGKDNYVSYRKVSVKPGTHSPSGSELLL